MPLRISSSKCIWIFDDMGTKAQGVQKCQAAGLSPLNLYQAYENRLIRKVLNYLTPQTAWTDAIYQAKTSFTWEGETSSYARWKNTSRNDWHTPCVTLNNQVQLTTVSCETRHAPLCTVPSAATCADLCPVGFTPVGGTCFKVHTDKTFDDPFKAREACLSEDGTFNLASISNITLSALLGHLKSIGAPAASHFWVGIDDSIRKSHPQTPFSNMVQFADPDGIWEMDNGNLFTFSAVWDFGNPVVNHTWTLLYYDGNNVTLRSTAVNATSITVTTTPDPTITVLPGPAAVPTWNYYICERPKPCFKCDKGWTFFNGHCYYLATWNVAGMHFSRGFCDLQQAYVISIGTPIEQMFASKLAGSNSFLLGLQRSHSNDPASFSKVDATYYEWDEGGRLADTGFAQWAGSSPDMGNYGLHEIATAFESDYWNDRDFHWASSLLICEKSAFIPSVQCPQVVAAGVACGENILSSQFNYSASSIYVTGGVSFGPENIGLSSAWCPSGDFNDFSEMHWIKIQFGKDPYYVRAIATLGGQTVAGMVTAYTVQYLSLETGTDADFVDIYVHKAATPMTKLASVVFAGNSMSSNRNSQEICPRILAYQIKIFPKLWYVKPFMRIEIKGCPASTPMPAFCDCWVESFDAVENEGLYAFWPNRASADSWSGNGADPMMASTAFTDAWYINGTYNSSASPAGWSPQTVDGANWWQVTFSVLKVITGIVMRGNGNDEWMAGYYLKWSHSGYEYTFNYYYGLDGEPRLFTGPMTHNVSLFSGGSMLIQQSFCPPMKTIALRIIPYLSVRRPTLVIDVFGCIARGRRCFDCCDEIGLCNCNCPVGWTGTACATVATDKNYYIDAQPPVCENELLTSMVTSVKASSPDPSVTPARAAIYGFSNTTSSFWAPDSTDVMPYWQVDFSPPPISRMIYVSLIKVAGSSNSFVSSYNLWFLVPHSDDRLYYPILEQQNNPQSNIKAIPGARDFNPTNYVPYYLCPSIRTRSLVIRPITKVGNDYAMRFQIYGCPAHAPCSTCCTYEDGCQCKCPIGFTTNYNSPSTNPNPWEHCDQWNIMPVDCEDYAMRQTNLPNGIYTIYPPGRSQMNVYCDMTSFGGGWTLIQNRYDNTQDFYRKWVDYREGFGKLDANFWLGNEKIHQLTSGVNTYQLLIKLTTTDAQIGLAYYTHFYLGDEACGYALHLDDEECCQIGDALKAHRGQRFYTKDNDTNTQFQCASNAYGGWWYKADGSDVFRCHDSNLNGFLDGTTAGTIATWATWRGYSEPMSQIQMMIRRSPLPNILKPLQPQYSFPLDCQDYLQQNPATPSGTYSIYPAASTTAVPAFCEMVAHAGGWTVIQRHYDSSISFHRNFSDYENGFGSPAGNYWIGNKNLRAMTDLSTNLLYRLAVVMEDSTGERRTAHYQLFWIDPAFSNQSVFKYYSYNPDGDVEAAGDGLVSALGQPFQTADMTHNRSCTQQRSSGWWYQVYNSSNHQCADSNPNGYYGNNNWEMGMYWQPWKGRYESLKVMTMMIKRVAEAKPIDCADLYNPALPAYNTSGWFWVYPFGSRPVQVYCIFDSSLSPSAYTVVQRRTESRVDFQAKTWQDYKNGFSSATDSWLGLDTLHKMVSSTAYSLRIRIKYEDSNGNVVTKTYFYSDFYVMSEDAGYLLFIKGGEGDAGDSLSKHNFMTFSTRDKNTTSGVIACVNRYLGGWWYNPASCDGAGTSNLNAAFNATNGMFWQTTASGDIIYSEMMMVRKSANSRTLNLPNTVATQLCPSKDIIHHSCEHRYKTTSGDSIRIMDPSTPGIYAGTDLICQAYPTPMDCTYYQNAATTVAAKFFSGARSDLYVPSTGTFTANCAQETFGGGWTVIHRRQDNTQNFLQDITAYDLPFGTASGNWWIGHNAIRGLTSTAKYELLVELKTNLSYGFVLYDLFYTTSSVNIIHLENSYNPASTIGDSLTTSDGKPFVYDPCGSGAWWYAKTPPCGCVGNSSFQTSNLNGLYSTNSPADRNLYWWAFSGGFTPSLMLASMKIRRAATHGRYIMAANFLCNEGVGFNQTVTDAQQCQDLCTTTTWFQCVTTCFYRSVNLCSLRNSTCVPNHGAVNKNWDTYFRVEGPTSVSPYCGPPPRMSGSSLEIINMPVQLSANYTCRAGYSNAAFDQAWTVLTCNSATRRWEGQWLECKTLCGDVPDLSEFNAVLTPNAIVSGGSVTILYECQQDYELVKGDLTRVCAPPYGEWTGGEVFCNTTRCASPPDVKDSWNNFTVPTVVPLDQLTRRYTVWNYTCNTGFAFVQSLSKSGTIRCAETKQWVPKTPGTCIPFRCENPPYFANAIIPYFPNGTYFEYKAQVFYQCKYNMVIDPLLWDNNVTIACVGNQTWGVINYLGKTQTWLPSRCIEYIEDVWCLPLRLMLLGIPIKLRFWGAICD